MPWGYRRKIRTLTKGMLAEGKNQDLFSRRRITLSADLITHSTQFTHSTTSWQGVERIERNDSYLFLFTSTLHAIIIPSRAFGTPSDFGAFVQAADQYYGDTRRA